MSVHRKLSLRDAHNVKLETVFVYMPGRSRPVEASSTGVDAEPEVNLYKLMLLLEVSLADDTHTRRDTSLAKQIHIY